MSNKQTVSKELVLKKISKSYNKIKIVNNVSISLERGSVVGLLGPNGAGKTTCFYIIAGLIKCDKGDIFLNNEKSSPK